VGVNDFSSNFVLRLLSETILNISPPNPAAMYVRDLFLSNICLSFGGITSVIRVADDGFYGTHIL
jgi:hypothetical protein